MSETKSKLNLVHLEAVFIEYGTIEKMEEENYYFNMRIVGFNSTIGNFNDCMSKVTEHISPHYSKISMVKSCNNHFHIMLRAI